MQYKKIASLCMLMISSLSAAQYPAWFEAEVEKLPHAAQFKLRPILDDPANEEALCVTDRFWVLVQNASSADEVHAARIKSCLECMSEEDRVAAQADLEKNGSPFEPSVDEREREKYALRYKSEAALYQAYGLLIRDAEGNKEEIIRLFGLVKKWTASLSEYEELDQAVKDRMNS